MSLMPAETLLDEITDFILSRPTEEEIINFRPSDRLNERLHELLDKNSHDAITSEERTELDHFLEIDHIFTMLKAKARLKLTSDE